MAHDWIKVMSEEFGGFTRHSKHGGGRDWPSSDSRLNACGKPKSFQPDSPSPELGRAVSTP